MHEINEKQRRFAINFIIYIITFCFLALIGISKPLADTNINMSTWTNVTGRKWSSNNYESSSNIISDTDTIRAYYNVSAPIYTPPNSFDYVDFLYFQHSGNFNPCNGDDYKTTFYLKFSTPSFVNYVSRVRFSYHSNTGLDSCIISSRNSTTGRVDVSCLTHYESDSNALIIWVDFNRNIPDTQNSWLYIQKNFPLSCMTNTQAIIENQNQNTQNIINNNNENTNKIIEENKEAEKTRKGILGKLKELFSWFSNDDDPDISGLNNMVGLLPPGPVDSIINLPLAFFNALTNTLSGTCQDVSLTIPFVNQILVLPCFDSYMSQYLQHFSTFWTLVGSIVSIFILYNYLLALYKWVDDTLTFRENNMPGYYGDNWGGGA